MSLWLRLIAASLCVLPLAGCDGPDSLIDEARAQQQAELIYPEAAELGPDLEVLVMRDRRKIRLVNLTPRSLRRVQVWLNAEYTRTLDRIEIGSDNVFALRRWVNSHGESYPTGSFLAPDKSRLLALAEVYDPRTGLRHRLVVQPQQDTVTGSLQTQAP